MIRNIITESDVIYEDDFIIFTLVQEDPFADGTYAYSVLVYKPMWFIHQIDNRVMQPLAYRNAGKKPTYHYAAFGYPSFISASNRMDEIVSQIIKEIE